jgi:acetolactate synthase-1/2/3 large subunit
MEKISGGYAVVKCLESEGVEVIFGQPGSHNLPIYDALRETRVIKHINVKYEGNAAVMADSYGRLTGKPGVCLTTAGPGATNCVTSIAQAHAARSPVIHITAHCETTSILPFHGVYDYNFLVDVFGPVTKACILVLDGSEISEIFSDAFLLCKDGKQGPVHIEIPRDILEEKTILNPYAKKEIISPEIELSSLSEITRKLELSRTPIILAGQGVIRDSATEELIRLAERISSPVMTPYNARTVIPFDHYLAFGYAITGSIGHFIHPLLKDIMEDSDMVLMVGSDPGEALVGFLKGHKNIIYINAKDDREPIHKISPALILNGNMKEILASLDSELVGFQAGEKAKVRVENTSKAKMKVRKDVEAFIAKHHNLRHPGLILAELRRVIGEEALVTSDTGIIDSWMFSQFPSRRVNDILTSGRYGAMGFALPSAIAAKLCFPDRSIVAICGDGSFLMSSADFGTAVEHNLEIIFVILNDRRFGSIAKMQELNFQGRYFSTDIHTPDFVRYAASFGAKGFTVQNPRGIQNVFEKASSIGGPVIINIECDAQVPLFSL